MFSQGVTLLANGNPAAALQEFQKSLADATGDQKADSLYNVGVCHVRLGNIEAAVQAVAEASLRGFEGARACAPRHLGAP